MAATGSAPKEIRFLAVCRRSDKVILAHRIHAATDRSTDYIANVQKVLNSPGWASVTTDKLSLDDGPSMFYVLLDEVRKAVTSSAGHADELAPDTRDALLLASLCRGPRTPLRFLLW